MSDYQFNRFGNIIRTTDGAMIPNDAGNRDYIAVQAWIAAGNTVAAYVPSPDAVQAIFVATVQTLLDSTAQQRNYDGILSACTYADSTVAAFKAEGQACVAWRDAVWAQCYADLAAVRAGTMPQPSIDTFLAGLPKLTWPTPAPQE
jgi:hypothetical protein